jgi:hypothetical protein
MSRRDFFRIGALGVGGLSLADLLRLRAQGAAKEKSSPKAVIMVYLPGGPSHIDMYDLKPDAPKEYRGEFKPIRTNVPGIDICEHMPLQAKIADKFAILRGLKTQGNHDPTELLTGIPAAASGQIGPNRRPAIGCVVSKLRGTGGPVPPYVSLSNHKLLRSYDDPEVPAYLGIAHKPIQVSGKPFSEDVSIMNDLTLPPEVSLQRLDDRKALLRTFDTLGRQLDAAQQETKSMDSFQARALEMITSTRVRDALDLSSISDKVRDRYGIHGEDFLRARRLIEEGVPIVSIAARFRNMNDETEGPSAGWDTHADNFRYLKYKLPHYDRAVSALISDLHERGLDQDVAVVIWGEFGRTPLVETRAAFLGGRGHWPEAGCALIAGGGLRMGQVIGETDRRAERPKGRVFRSQHVLATLYHVLGIDPEKNFPDHTGRPQYILDNRETIAELV